MVKTQMVGLHHNHANIDATILYHIAADNGANVPKNSLFSQFYASSHGLLTVLAARNSI
jgi:hypothetical protein